MWNFQQQFPKMVNIDDKFSKAGLILEKTSTDYLAIDTYMKQVNKWKTKNKAEIKRPKLRQITLGGKLIKLHQADKKCRTSADGPSRK